MLTPYNPEYNEIRHGRKAWCRAASPAQLLVAPPAPIRSENTRRKRAILLLAIGITLLFGILLSESSFDLPFLNPDSNQQLWFFVALTGLVFLLFVLLTFVLFRNVLKLFAERRLGVLGSKFRTRLVVVGLLQSFLPVIFMFWFAYGLMNRSIERWFSTPVEEVRRDTEAMASMLSQYAYRNALAEAKSIASAPETERAFEGHSFSTVMNEFHRHETTMQGGFAIAIADGNAEASFAVPAAWPILRAKIPMQQISAGRAAHLQWEQTEYVLGSAPVGDHGLILVGMPLPANFSATQRQIEASQERYYELAAQRRLVRRTYMDWLLLLTVMVLFATLWLNLFLSKLVTRPVAALAEATQEISRGNLDYRVEVTAADEIGDLVRSFNRMAEELEASRRQIEASSRDLGVANITLEQRRRHMETVLESIPTGVLSLDAGRRVTHANHALLRLFSPRRTESGTPEALVGASLSEVFPAEVLEDLQPLLRRADRMGTTTTQMEIALSRAKLNVAVTVATLQHGGQGLGYVLVFEDLSDLLKAQKQAAWREVARRVAHEIKNPLTPIALSAERIRRHLGKGTPPDSTSVEVLRGCAESIGSAVETLRTLVDEFSTLARFPTARPLPANINSIVESALAMFNGRLDSIQVQTFLGSDLPEVMADSEAIKRAVANLVDNAAEAVQGALLREIHISTSLVASRDAVEIVIADTGHGVTQELKEKLFLPYFSTKKRGTGLGLAIVSRIIEDHHGSIRVEENEPLGAKFVVELPVAAEAVPEPAVSQHA
ncbi:MAG TPA: ATP-binding protein [Terriglobales bacterium]|nr:ATP-binding protein [Terriglobales bacterium]